ncbi:RNA 2',3'-cyclic phosphodiesterase [Paraliobacillus sp. JSM ZJ581]|uniref:RNA 2',3'-cyclic phosphodiesterase n=1 Tax=Paraliobacillus sp. JSM ZJ581 TaxID=3342118 RepID=UPI0035A95544
MVYDSHYFLAISIPDQLKLWVKEQQQQLLQLSKLSYKHHVDFADFHITIKFLGPASIQKKQRMINQLQQLKNNESFHLSIGSIGHFGSPTQPRVLWLRVALNNHLIDLFQQIESITEKIGFPKENKFYQPHITLVKKWRTGHLDQQDWNRMNKQINEKQLLTVDTFKLYQIEPNEKPMYKSIQKFKLL